MNVAADLVEHREQRLPIRGRQPLSELKANQDGDQVLLDAVMERSLEPLPLGIRNGDEPQTPRRARAGSSHGVFIHDSARGGGSERAGNEAV